MSPLLLKHLQKEDIGRFPVWIMRQAGRYLPEYQKIRKNHSFWEMVSDPSLATEVSLLPIEILDVDAVIFFSDILTPFFGMDIPIELKESVGPVLDKPFRTLTAFEPLADFDPQLHTAFVGQTLSQIRSALDPKKALIGFAGAPWTVACYLVEGQGKKGFPSLLSWLYEDPSGVGTVLEILGALTSRYLQFQVKSGAQLVQVFDTWVGEMPTAFFQRYYKPTLQQLFKDLRPLQVPVVYFPKNAAHLTEELVDLDFDVLGCDNLLSLPAWDHALSGKFSLQGNLSPHALLGSESRVRELTQQLVAEARKLRLPGILNLGHGVLKQTPVANVKAFVEEAQRPWN